MAKQLSGAEVKAILEDGTGDQQILGTFETAALDFKGAPYRLDEKSEEWELAKDVAAMANSGGGFIVMGVHTEKDHNLDEEHASKIAPFPAGMFDPKKAHDVIARDVYPPVEGLRIQLVNRGDKRLGYVEVPPQDPDLEPFLLTRSMSDDGEIRSSFVQPRRSGSHTAYVPVGLLHRDIADGRRLRKAGQASLHGSGSRDGKLPSGGQEAEAWLSETASVLQRELGWDRHAGVYLAAVPGESLSRPPDFFDVDGLRRDLGNDTQLRPMGFGLTYGVDVELRDDELLSYDADRTALQILATGHVVAAAAGTPGFLGWAMDQQRSGPAPPREPLKINPVVLAEWVYEFCRFIHRAVVPRWGGDSWSLAVLVQGARSAERPLRMPTTADRVMLRLADGTPAEADRRLVSFDYSADPKVDAIRLLGAVYGVFSLPVTTSPFNREGEFDEALLVAGGPSA